LDVGGGVVLGAAVGLGVALGHFGAGVGGALAFGHFEAVGAWALSSGSSQKEHGRL
jgi:hypothetical protein